MSTLAPPDPNALKKGDTAALQAKLSDFNGPVNLAGATVRMRMRNLGTGVEVALAGVNFVLQSVGASGRIVNRGLVEYEWGPGETDTVGVFGLDWRVTFASGESRSFPNDRLVTLRIVAVG